MPRLRTDDGPRKLRAVWLGPAGNTLPFQWTYVQWAVTLLAVPIAGTIGTTIVWFLLGDPVWAFGLGGLWFGAGGVYLAIRMMKNVTFDEPLSYHRRLVGREFSRQFSQPVGPREVAVEFQVPPISYLSPAVRRSMGWDVPAQRPLTVTEPAAPSTAAHPNPYLATTPTSPTSPAVVDSPSAEPDRPPLDTPSTQRTNPYVTSRP
jgi:hypothetical protein